MVMCVESAWVFAVAVTFELTLFYQADGEKKAASIVNNGLHGYQTLSCLSSWLQDLIGNSDLNCNFAWLYLH